MLPSEYPEVQTYASLRQLLAAHVDMQFDDLRTLLLLPRGKALRGGCNFATAALMFNIIAGSSVCFYKVDLESLSAQRNRGKRFKELLERYFPWEGESLSKTKFVSLLYDLARNPLVHSLGLDPPPAKGVPGEHTVLTKWPLTPAKVASLEESVAKPRWAYPTVTTTEYVAGGKEHAISIPALYWGVHIMLRKVFADPVQADGAERLASEYEKEWTWYVYGR